MRIIKTQGDLFSFANRYAFVQLVARDGLMNTGIAKQFTEKYSNMKLKMQKDKSKLMTPGIFPYLSNDNRRIYNLIVKENSFEKATRENLTETLYLLKDILTAKNDKYLAMPLIGSGLNKLDWITTEESIYRIFGSTDENIVFVYYFN
jgi:hypothetical protein